MGTVIPNIFRDLPFTRNQPLKSADDCHIRILKNKNEELYKVLDELKKDWTFWFKLRELWNIF